MSYNTTAPFDWSAYRVALASGSRTRVRTAMKMLRRWYQVARERNQLAKLDERALKDIGVSRSEALAEAERPFWDVGARKPID